MRGVVWRSEDDKKNAPIISRQRSMRDSVGRPVARDQSNLPIPSEVAKGGNLQAFEAHYYIFRVEEYQMDLKSL